jgi:hypothetical protein
VGLSAAGLSCCGSFKGSCHRKGTCILSANDLL